MGHDNISKDLNQDDLSTLTHAEEPGLQVSSWTQAVVPAEPANPQSAPFSPSLTGLIPQKGDKGARPLALPSDAD